MIRFAISDRKLHPGNDAAQSAAIVAQAARLSASGVDFFQVREKDLSSDELVTLVRQIVTAARANGPMRVLVNGPADVARQAGADGIHLTSIALMQSTGKWLGGVTIISASCHTEAEILHAKEKGADFILFGPVFGKTVRGEAVQQGSGVEALRHAISAAGDTPLIALGGITAADQQACIDAGAAGIAGIRMFL